MHWTFPLRRMLNINVRGNRETDRANSIIAKISTIIPGVRIHPFPGIGSRRSDKRRLCNKSPEAKFTLQRDTTNDRVTIVIEEARLYPPRFFFSSELRCSSHPFLPPSPSSNHDKSMIKEEKKKEEPKKTRARVCIEIRKNSEDTVSSLASIWHDSLLFFFCPED